MHTQIYIIVIALVKSSERRIEYTRTAVGDFILKDRKSERVSMRIHSMKGICNFKDI